MDENLTLKQAYLAMHKFAQDYFDRGPDPDQPLVLFLAYAQPNTWVPWDSNPLGSGDPAAWNDWLSAVKWAVERPKDSWP